MSRLAELIEELCPDGVEYKPLGELLVYQQPTPFLVSSKDYDPSYPTPVLTAGATFLLGYSSETHGVYAASTDDPVIIFDDFTTASKWVDFPFKLKSSAAKILTAADPSVADIRFLYFLMQTIKYQVGSHARHWIAVYSKMPVCCPPLEVQREIVRILDQFTTLEAELEARRAQYEHYRNHLLSYDSLAARGAVEMVNLGGVALRVVTGVTPQASNARYYEGGSNPWIRTQDVNFNRISVASEFVTDAAIDELPLKWVKANCVIVAISGASAGRSALLGIDAVTNQHCCNLEIDPKRADYRYVYYSIAARYNELRSLGRGARGDLNVSIIKSFEIPLPSVDQQSAVADLLDHFDALVNDITSGLPAEIAARRAQYEHYRDRLLSFPEKGVSGSDAS